MIPKSFRTNNKMGKKAKAQVLISKVEEESKINYSLQGNITSYTTKKTTSMYATQPPHSEGQASEQRIKAAAASDGNVKKAADKNKDENMECVLLPSLAFTRPSSPLTRRPSLPRSPL